MLRLYLGAKDFRIRRNQYSTCATFKCGDGSRVRIVYKYVSLFDDKKSYLVDVTRGGQQLEFPHWAAEVGMVRSTVQQLTGAMLDCFEN